VIEEKNKQKSMAKITNDKPLGLFIHTLYTQSNKSRAYIAVQSMANEAVRFYLNKPANKENCQNLLTYLNESLAELNQLPDCDAKSELVEQIEKRISLLKDAIQPAHPGVSTKPSNNYRPGNENKGGSANWRSYDERYEACLKAYKVNDCYKKFPTTKDPNTLEGYIRNIPNVDGMSVNVFLDKYVPDLLKRVNFVKKVGKDEYVEIKDYELTGKTIDLLVTHFLKKFAFVQLTLSKPDNVIEDQTASDIFNFVQEVGMEEPVEVATA
jgi:hypothetical protein